MSNSFKHGMNISRTGSSGVESKGISMSGENTSVQSSAVILEMMHDVRDAELDVVSQGMLDDENLFRVVLDGLTSKEEMFRYNCFKSLLQFSRQQPEMVYPEWEHFGNLLDDDNAFLRAQGVHLLAALLPFDQENRFDRLFEKYFGLLGDTSLFVARYVAQNAAEIVRNRPDLQPAITEKMLKIEKVAARADRVMLIKSDILQSFDEYFDQIEDQETIRKFAEGMLQGDSPKARKAAKSFLKKHGG